MKTSTRQPLHEVMEVIEAHIAQGDRILVVCKDGHQMNLMKSTYPIFATKRMIQFVFHDAPFWHCQGFCPSPVIINVTESPKWWDRLRNLYPDSKRIFVNL